MHQSLIRQIFVPSAASQASVQPDGGAAMLLGIIVFNIWPCLGIYVLKWNQMS